MEEFGEGGIVNEGAGQDVPRFISTAVSGPFNVGQY